MQQWCRAAAFEGETTKIAEIVICSWEYLEIRGACKTGRVEVDPNPAARPDTFRW